MMAVSRKPPIIVVCGPTGIGKTSAAIEIAEAFGGEIVGADSMQVYRYMDIGTAKPTLVEQRRVRHHLIDMLDPQEDFNAARFALLARQTVYELYCQGIVAVVTGGTGLYIKALIHGLFEAEAPDPHRRRQLRQEAAAIGTAALHERLARIDSAAAARIHPNDEIRIIRALETYDKTGKRISEHQQAHNFPQSHFRVFKVGLKMERALLYERINRRVEHMIACGLLQEVKGLMGKGYGKELKSMQALGYRHMIAYLGGKTDWEETVRTLKRDHRRYAKRQLTWFRADPEIIWTEPAHLKALFPKIRAFLGTGGSRP